MSKKTIATEEQATNVSRKSLVTNAAHESVSVDKQSRSIFRETVKPERFNRTVKFVQ